MADEQILFECDLSQWSPIEKARKEGEAAGFQRGIEAAAKVCEERAAILAVDKPYGRKISAQRGIESGTMASRIRTLKEG